MQILANGSENTGDPIRELWKRVTQIDRCPCQFPTQQLMQTSTLWTQKSLVVRLKFSGRHSQERTVWL